MTRSDAGLLPSVTLAVGEEGVLVDRAVSRVLRAARALDPAVAVNEIIASRLEAGELGNLLAPSLFSEARVVILTGVQDCGKDTAAEVLAYARSPLPEVVVVLTHAGGAKSKTLLTDLLKTGATRVDCAKITRPGDRKDLVRKEFTIEGRRIGDTALDRLLEAVGTDLRELFGAASQLMSDTNGQVTEQAVAAYYTGRAETSGFAVADAALDGNLSGALELARWAKSTGVADVLVSSALASGLRLVAQVAGKNSQQAAAATGMPSWKIDKAVRQSRGWTRTGLTVALLAVATLDRDVKGGSPDPIYAMERALVAICRARRTKDDPDARWEAFGRAIPQLLTQRIQTPMVGA